MSTRPDNTRNLRVVLDTTPVPPGKGYKGEAGIAVAMLDRLTARKEPHIDGICYDGAFRGIHIDHAMKAGLTVLAPTHAGTAKPTALSAIDCSCGDTHELWTDQGRLHERSILDIGETHLQPLPVAKVYARRNRAGIYRWYIDFATACGTVHHQRIDTTDIDLKKSYNRAEHLRQHTKTEEGDSIYDRCYGWREDAESLNSTLDRTLYGGRITAHSATRQHSVMIGFALGRNALAAYIHQRHQQPTAAWAPQRGQLYPPDSHTYLTQRTGLVTAPAPRAEAPLPSIRRSASSMNRPYGFSTPVHTGPPPSALVAQGIEHGSPKAGVAGSNPAEGTNSAVQELIVVSRLNGDDSQQRSYCRLRSQRRLCAPGSR